MRVLYLVSAGGDAMRRAVTETLLGARGEYELRALAPDAEARGLRLTGVPVESWRPAGLFNVLRSIGALRRTVERFDPQVIHAFGWTAGAVAMGALPGRYARRSIISLQDPIRDGEMPKPFIEKRLPELLLRAAAITCAYENLHRGVIEMLGVPAERVSIEPPGAKPLLARNTVRAAGRRGPIVGYVGKLEAELAWETAIGAVAALRETHPDAQLWLARGGPVQTLVRSFARGAGAQHMVTFFDELPTSELFTGIDMLAIPKMRDGLPYAAIEALTSGVPFVAANSAGLADTLAPYAGYLTADDAVSFSAAIAHAWSEIDHAWEAAQAQRVRTEVAFDPDRAMEMMLARYERVAAAAEETVVAEAEASGQAMDL